MGVTLLAGRDWAPRFSRTPAASAAIVKIRLMGGFR